MKRNYKLACDKYGPISLDIISPFNRLTWSLCFINCKRMFISKITNYMTISLFAIYRLNLNSIEMNIICLHTIYFINGRFIYKLKNCLKFRLIHPSQY